MSQQGTYVLCYRTKPQKLTFNYCKFLSSARPLHFLISETNFLTKLSHKFGKFRLHGERQRCLCEHRGWGTVPLFTILLQQASADCHCMLAGESMIASNMKISAFYRTQKLRFNVPHTYFVFNYTNKIGLPPAIANIGLFKWNHFTITSFSTFNNLVIYLDLLFNGSTFQHLKVSRHVISASTHFYMHFGV